MGHPTVLLVFLGLAGISYGAKLGGFQPLENDFLNFQPLPSISINNGLAEAQLQGSANTKTSFNFGQARSQSYGSPSRNYGVPSHSQSFRPTSVITNSFQRPIQSFTPGSNISVTPGTVISQQSRLTQSYRNQPLVSQSFASSGVSRPIVSESYRRSPHRTSSFLAPNIIPGRH